MTRVTTAAHEGSHRSPCRAATLTLVLAAFAGCSQAAPATDPRSTAGGPSQPIGSGTASTDHVAEGAFTAPPPAAPAPLKERPPRNGVRGSTKGAVACGARNCNAPGEVCAWDETESAWTCGPPRASSEDPSDIGFACDDGTDCPAGETCCRLFSSAGVDHAACVVRADVDRRCSAEVCMSDGARCPAGRKCSASSPDRQGTCEAPKGPATCADKKRCPAERPICILEDTTLECVELDSVPFRAVASDRRWQCTRREDCSPGDTCAFAFDELAHELSTACGRYSPLVTASVCDPSGPSPCGGDAACRAAHQCRSLAGAPPWMGIFDDKP